MADRTGQIIEYNTANKQGLIKPDDGGPDVRFYLRNLSDPAKEPKPGYKVEFDAPPARMNKKREKVQDPASSVSVTDTSTVLAPRRADRGGGGRGERSFKGRGPRGRPGERGPGRGGPRGPREERGPRPERAPRERPPRAAGERAEAPAPGQRERKPRPPRAAGSRGVKWRDARLKVEIKSKGGVIKGGRTAGAAAEPSTYRFLPAVSNDVRRVLKGFTSGAISPSLLLDKYPRCSIARKKRGERSASERSFSERSKREFLEKSFLGAYRFCWENRGAWQSIYRRHVELIKVLESDGHKVFSLALRTSSRLAAGHRSPRVLEESAISLHRLYGFPGIPASLIKGTMRFAARKLSAPGGMTDEELRKIFGAAQQPAKVIFFDALPLTPPGIEVDLHNCHYPYWYDEGDPPADDQVPRPAYFLTIKPGSQFVFTLALERGADPHLLDKAGALLKTTLTEVGIGAKTSVGYGLFS